MEEKAKYRIIKKQLNGIEIQRFILESIDDGKQAAVSLEDTVKLARVGKLLGVTPLLDLTTGEYIINFNGTLKNIQEHNSIRLRLLCRLVDITGKCIGYKAQDNSNKTYKISINKAWELAIHNSVINVVGKVINNKKVLLGINDFSLSQLPTMME